jgi:hypothetical protein
MQHQGVLTKLCEVKVFMADPETNTISIKVCRMPRLTTLRTVACLTFLVLPIASRAECRKAHDDEVPQGANELIELREQKIRGLFGTTFLPNDEPAEDVVIEVYSLQGHEDYSVTTQKKRLTACVTGADGKFSFAEFKAGRYLLRAGVRKPHGINITYVIINLKSNGSGNKGRGIRIPMTLGT